MNILEAKNITKMFPGVIALDSVDVAFKLGEIHAIISNVGNTVYEIKADDKIGQLIILPIVIPDFTYESWKERGTGAFGSTGR